MSLPPIHCSLIPLNNYVTKLFYVSIYNLSQTKLRYLKEYIGRILARGWIHLSKSSFSSPILFVKKDDGSLCLVINY